MAKRPATVEGAVPRHVGRLGAALIRVERRGEALRRAARFAGTLRHAERGGRVPQHAVSPGAVWRGVVPCVGEVTLPVAARPVSRRERDAQRGQPDAEPAQRAAGERQGLVFAALAPPHGWQAQAKP